MLKGLTSIYDNIDWKEYRTRLFIALIGMVIGFIYIQVSSNNCDDELRQVHERYEEIKWKDEIHGNVIDIHGPFCFTHGDTFIGIVGSRNCMIQFRAVKIRNFDLCVGDSISKKPNSDIMIVFRGKYYIICKLY